MRSRRQFLGCILAAAVLHGCGGDQSSATSKSGGKSPSSATTSPSGDSPIASRSGDRKIVRVVCSFFPVYLFTKNVVGDAPGVSVELLLPASKGCPHGYDLKPSEVAKVVEADVFVLNGAGMEAFDEKKIKGDFKAKATIVDCCKGMKLLDADEEEHDHDHKPGEAHHHHEHGGKNPHCFSSPAQAALQVKNIADGLAAADPGHAETYRRNGEAYAVKLAALGAEFKTQLAGVASKKIVTMHEAFDYLAKDAGLEIVGELQSGAGSELKPAAAKKLIDAMKKDKVPAVFREPQYDQKTAQMIAKEAGAVVELLDPVASGPDDAAADYYEKTMRKNLETLVKVLGKK